MKSARPWYLETEWPSFNWTSVIREEQAKGMKTLRPKGLRFMKSVIRLSKPLTLKIVFIQLKSSASIANCVLSIPGLWQGIIDCILFLWNIYINTVTSTAVFLILFITMVIFFTKFAFHYLKIFTKWHFANILDVLIYYQQNFPLLSKNLKCQELFQWSTDKVCVCVCACVCVRAHACVCVWKRERETECVPCILHRRMKSQIEHCLIHYFLELSCHYIL